MVYSPGMLTLGVTLIRRRQGRVLSVQSLDAGASEIGVEVEGRLERAISYDDLTGRPSVGTEVTLNTTAVDLGLGTGGFHFVMGVTPPDSEPSADDPGHCIKLRYTPAQMQCLCVEEQDSPHRERIEAFTTLHGMPVAIGGLHSMLGPAAAGMKHATGGTARVAYVMTDSGALPLAFSKLVRRLKGTFIDATITAGQAFGGDYEAVNVYSALIAAKEVAQADLAIVAMGPGKLGTGTKYGFSEIEQGEIVNAVNALGGTAIAIPRISFGRPGYRHYGVSPHTITCLSEIALTPATVPIAQMDHSRLEVVMSQLASAGLDRRYRLEILDGRPALDALLDDGIAPDSMGRNVEDEMEFFLTAGAAGLYAGKLWNCSRSLIGAVPGLARDAEAHV